MVAAALVAVAGSALPAALPLVLPGVPVASAQTGDARFRVFHFVPDAPSVDVYVDGRKKLVNVPYEANSDYLQIPAGSHTFEIRATGTAADSPAAIKTTSKFDAGKTYTLAALGASTIAGKVYVDDLKPPASGKAKVRVLHAAGDAPTVDVAANGNVLFPKITYGMASAYAEVAAGSYDLALRRTGTPDVLLSLDGLAVQPGGIYTVAAVGGSGQPTRLKAITDLAPPGGPGLTSTSTTATPATSTPATTAAKPTTTAKAAATTPPTAAPTTATPTTATPTTARPTTTAAPTTTARPTTTAAPTTTARPTTTAAPTTTARPTTTAAPTTTARPTTTAAPTTTEAPVETTEPVLVEPDTSVAPTTMLPAGGVATGGGGLAGSRSGLTLLVLLLAATGYVGTSALRHRRS